MLLTYTLMQTSGSINMLLQKHASVIDTKFILLPALMDFKTVNVEMLLPS